MTKDIRNLLQRLWLLIVTDDVTMTTHIVVIQNGVQASCNGAVLKKTIYYWNMSHFAIETETDAVYSAKELIASEVPRKIYQILSKEVVCTFSENHDPPEESVIQAKIVRPLEGLWGAKEVYKVLQSVPTVANFCGKVFKNGEPAIFCKLVQPNEPTL